MKTKDNDADVAQNEEELPPQGPRLRHPLNVREYLATTTRALHCKRITPEEARTRMNLCDSLLKAMEVVDREEEILKRYEDEIAVLEGRTARLLAAEEERLKLEKRRTAAHNGRKCVCRDEIEQSLPVKTQTARTIAPTSDAMLEAQIGQVRDLMDDDFAERAKRGAALLQAELDADPPDPDAA